MRNRNLNPTVIEEMVGATGIALTVLTSPLLRPWYSRWGATKTELAQTLPGDDVVRDPNMQNTRAITIAAPVKAVWPWLVQMGQGRGGLYSYERLENLVGCDMHNADQIMPEHQQLTVGDKMHLSQGEGGPTFTVTAITPHRAIIFDIDDPPTSWSFVLQPLDDNHTRLLIRYRQDFEPTFGNVVMWRVLTDPIHFVMERKMLQGIKLRAETTATALFQS